MTAEPQRRRSKLEVVLGEQMRCEQDDGALHSAACASGRGYEEESGYWGEERLMALVTHACGENGLGRRRGGNK